MIVRNTKTMAILLEALGLRQYQWLPTQEHIELQINQQELAYAINSADDAVQDVYGHTDEWQDLIKYL